MTDHTGRAHVRAAAEEPHTLPELRLPPTLLAPPGSGITRPKRVEIPRLGEENGFQVFDLLSDSECTGLVALSEERGYQGVAWEYDPVSGAMVRELP